jgi:putative transport protein
MWLSDLLQQADHSVAAAVLILSIVAACGIGVGSIKIRGISLGVAGVLFSGLVFGHFFSKWDIHLNREVREFAEYFGLILFVYTIGMQVGPSFIASLRRQGLPLNLMAGGVVLGGIVVALLLHYLGGIEVPVVVGLLSGGTTNTPSLAAAQQALADSGAAAEVLKQPGVAYAIAYPFGIIGVIGVMIVIRTVFGIDAQKEAELLLQLQQGSQQPLQRINLEVQNPNLDGQQLAQVPMLSESGVVISRVMHQGKAQVPQPDYVLARGDILHAVGPAEALKQLKVIVGSESAVDVKDLPSNITSRRIVVTRSGALGQTIADLNIRKRFGVTVTRVHRAEVELPPVRTPLQFADTLVVVGDLEAIQRVAKELGDSVRQLNHPQIIPLFVGIALGVLLGTYPFQPFGISVPLKLGLAGGPLVVAIVLSRLGNVGPLVWYMPLSANFMLRELGIVLFLSCVGLRSGDQLIATLSCAQGWYWIGCGAILTFVPLMLVGLIARGFYKLNYLTLCGMLAGSMTDPPALSFASSVTGSDAPSISYATVYPLVMLLRVIAAQAMVLIFMR